MRGAEASNRHCFNTGRGANQCHLGSPRVGQRSNCFLDELRLQAGNHCEVTFVDLTDEFFFP